MQDKVFVKIILLIKTTMKYKQIELLDQTILFTYGMLTGHRVCYFGKKQWLFGMRLNQMLFGRSPEPYPCYLS
jgi:hypothetical protein